MKQSKKFLKDIGEVLFVENPRNKNIRLSLHPVTCLRISYPPKTDYKILEEFIYRYQNQIEKHLLQHKNEKIKPVIINRQKAIQHLTQRINFLAKKHDLPFNKLSFRNQKTRWGSCSYKNNISLNLQIFLLPELFQDYVLLHELVHTKIKNHGNEFWNKLEKIMPGAKNYNRQMKKIHLKKIEII